MRILVLPLTLGAQDGATASRYYMGWMDDTRVYNRALSLNEIQQLAGVTPSHALTVIKTGTGTGTVTSTPPGINCGPTCSYNFDEDTLVTLTAAPAAGSTFSGWSGACTGTGTCQVMMDAAKSVTASFELEAACYTLTTSVSPAGSGTINATAQNCTGGYVDGTIVQLTAIPNPYYVFAQWSGDASGNANPLSVMMDGNKSITAEFVPNAGASLDFGGTNAYVDFGNPAKLHLPEFTIETWFRRDGPGDTTLTGTGGSNATALVARGRGQTEDPTVDLNYFLGIDVASNKLVADFEEGATGTNPSQNHPVYGATTITTGVWHHAAATYDGTTWKLYLDGVLDGELMVSEPPAAAGNQRASVGAGLYSTGEPDGFFDGVIDEARIWDRPLSASEIRASINQELTTGSGLVARWGLNEGIGTAIDDSLLSPADGTILRTNYAWTTIAPFDIPISPIISGNAGVAGATLNYTDGTPKTAMSASPIYLSRMPRSKRKARLRRKRNLHSAPTGSEEKIKIGGSSEVQRCPALGKTPTWKTGETLRCNLCASGSTLRQRGASRVGGRKGMTTESNREKETRPPEPGGLGEMRQEISQTRRRMDRTLGELEARLRALPRDERLRLLRERATTALREEQDRDLREAGELPGGRHFAVWHDPWPKPAYLFALVGGRLGHIEDTFVTMSGRKVALRIPPGTQSGEVFRVRGRGMPDPRSGRTGDLLVQTYIEVPKKLIPRQEELLRELAVGNRS